MSSGRFKLGFTICQFHFDNLSKIPRKNPEADGSHFLQTSYGFSEIHFVNVCSKDNCFIMVMKPAKRAQIWGLGGRGKFS